MKLSLKKIKNIFLKIVFIFGVIGKKYPWFVFVLFIVTAFVIAAYIFYQEAYLATNFSPDPQVRKTQINESSLLEIKQILGQHQKNIDEAMQKDFRNPFE